MNWERDKVEKLVIVIPAYNEENIENVVISWHKVAEEIDKQGYESQLLIVDDGSTDHTFEVLSKLSKDRSLLKTITKDNQGHGATLLYGYKYALEEGATWIFQTDSDGQTLASEFWDFWKYRDEYDMVIGNRTKREDGISRIIVTKILKLVIWSCFGVWVTDANTPFRLMRREWIEESLKYIPDDYNLTNVILSVICEKRKLRVKYIPITFLQRQGGINSINIAKITKIGIKALKDFVLINRNINREIETK